MTEWMKVYDPYGAFGRKRDVKYKRPLFDISTPLKDVPAGWLMHVEPFIIRNSQFKDCWMWMKAGGRTPAGDPRISLMIDGKQHFELAKRYIAQLFLNVGKLEPTDYDIVQLCQNRDCMNPGHIQARTDSAMSRRGIMLKERDKYLSPSEYYQP